jgi:hypothetical protein
MESLPHSVQAMVGLRPVSDEQVIVARENAGILLAKTGIPSALR